MSLDQYDLAELGWNRFFSSQLTAEDIERYAPARVISVRRGQLSVIGPGIDQLVPSRIAHAATEEDFPTAGDWLLLDRKTCLPERILHRTSLFKRQAAGTGRKVQLIAANVDTLFIVSSCNQDFNLPRLERYLVLAGEAGVTPVIVLTKADLTETAEDFAKSARGLKPGLLVEVVNARDPESVACLSSWCGPGQTVALLGSSGVGKSTLVNTLAGTDVIATQTVREDDDKGRHTTTGRALYHLQQGGWLLDTPGMRELQLTNSASGLDDVFSDITSLVEQCRFNDCKHETEPGCAVLSAIESGSLDADRLQRWLKLSAEQARHTESLVERRTRDRAFGKMIRNAVQQKKQK